MGWAVHGQVNSRLRVYRGGSCWHLGSPYCLRGGFGSHQGMLCLPGLLPELKDKSGGT